jgi:hypothetical protein
MDFDPPYHKLTVLARHPVENPHTGFNEKTDRSASHFARLGQAHASRALPSFVRVRHSSRRWRETSHAHLLLSRSVMRVPNL